MSDEDVAGLGGVQPRALISKQNPAPGEGARGGIRVDALGEGDREEI